MMAAERRLLEDAPDARYLSVAQVARRLDCSVSLVQKWRRLGWLRATRLGPPDVPVYGYLPEDVDRFAAERWNRRRGRPPGAGQQSGERETVHSATRDGKAEAAPPAPEAAVPATPEKTALPASPALSPIAVASGRPLVLWDADPRTGVAIVLARFGPHELDYALGLGATWAPNYDTLALGVPAAPGAGRAVGAAPEIVALWKNGERTTPPD